MTDQTKTRGKGFSRPRSTTAIGSGRGARSPTKDSLEELCSDALAPAVGTEDPDFSPPHSPRMGELPTSPVPSDEPDTHRQETIQESGLSPLSRVLYTGTGPGIAAPSLGTENA